ncbi:hypothetical protein L1987_80895 [Smallanthus sonchifolius]|uniref:Uncharacterized protein n=1 Tax=Smallanthus sonchifolius TaxID=185202 RepID=A0ACB8YP12_9ASTR|nr:hypothetical protein L1987_80895 [Smallanthus sonchifolius]
MDGIPTKLAHYVVDKFNPDEMEIMLPCGSIKIDSEVIHQLLGLPKGGVSFSSLVELDIIDEGVSRRKNWYPGRQMLEIQGGGFGVGPLKAMSSHNDIECDEDTPVVDQMKYPEDAEILSLKEKYENMHEEKTLWQTITKKDIIIAKDQISSVLKGVNLEKGESSSNEEIEEQDQETGGNMQIGESEENVKIGKTDMMESYICGVENEQLELGESCVSPCISQYKKIKSDCEGREYEASEESVKDQRGGGELTGFVAMLNEAVNLSIEEEDVAKKDETTSAMAAIPVTVINVTDIQTVNSGGSKSIVDNILVDQEACGKKDNEKGKVVITTGKEEVITTDNKMGKIIAELESKRKNPLREKAITIYEKSPYQLRGVDLNAGVTKEEE